jgi:hypothetical protein
VRCCGAAVRAPPTERATPAAHGCAALKKELDIPATIKEIVGAAKEAEFLAALDSLAENAFDDQCTGANPRYPLIKGAWPRGCLHAALRRRPATDACVRPARADLRGIFEAAWTKPILPLTSLPHYTPAQN